MARKARPPFKVVPATNKHSAALDDVQAGYLKLLLARHQEAQRQIQQAFEADLRPLRSALCIPDGVAMNFDEDASGRVIVRWNTKE